MSEETVRYYARRASEYERVYEMPSWRDDLPALHQMVASAFAGRSVFEIACGIWVLQYRTR